MFRLLTARDMGLRHTSGVQIDYAEFVEMLRNSA